MRHYPKKLVYVSNGGYNTKAILVSSPGEYDDVILETIELGDSVFEDRYRQVAAACGAEFVDVNDIKIIGQDDQPMVNKDNGGEYNEK
jgi:hypothetical protein